MPLFFERQESLLSPPYLKNNIANTRILQQCFLLLLFPFLCFSIHQFLNSGLHLFFSFFFLVFTHQVILPKVKEHFILRNILESERRSGNIENFLSMSGIGACHFELFL